jgi:predicted nucleic acid-binding protein
VTTLYADSSALVRAYLGDEPGSTRLREILLESDDVVVTSELSLVEVARAFRAAERSGRIPRDDRALEGVEADFSAGGPVLVIGLRPDPVLRRARAVVLEHRVGTLDAIHLAVAIEERRALDEPIVFVTRDDEQAIAAQELGFEVA